MPSTFTKGIRNWSGSWALSHKIADMIKSYVQIAIFIIKKRLVNKIVPEIGQKIKGIPKGMG